MEVSTEDITQFLGSIKKYRTIREGSSDFRCESAKDPSLDRHSFAKGYELGMYYAIDSLCGTEWVDNHLNKFGKKSHPSSEGGLNCPEG